MGANTILTADGGRLEFDRTHNITEPGPVSNRRCRARGFGEPFGGFGGTGFWRNLNMDPHAPTVGRLIEALYERVTGVPIDGVIFVDPLALAHLLVATGPIDDPLAGPWRLTVVDHLANEAYQQFGSAADRKRVLGAAVLVVFERFLDGTDPIASFRALAEAAAGGDLVMHSTDPGVQATLEAAGVAGTVEAPEAGDLFGVFASNADGTKIDYFVKRSLSYHVTLEADGSSNARVEVSAENTAPADPERSYVFGPYPNGLEPGCHWRSSRCTAHSAAGSGRQSRRKPQGLSSS
jgi:hypothetical protein